MRLLITTDTVGGVWTFTSELTQQLLGRGHQVHLVSFGRKPSAEQNRFYLKHREAYPESFGYTASDIPLEWTQENERAHSDGWDLLNYVIQSAARPELILANQFCFGSPDTAIPRVVVAHSDVISWAHACKPSALEPTPWLDRYVAMVQAGLDGAAAVVAPSAWMGNALAANFCLPRNYQVIPNGVSIEPASDPSSNRKSQAITAGRLWDEAKGLDTLRDLHIAMPLLVAGENVFNSPDPNASWPGNLVSLGPLSPSELHAQFRESDFYLCTSRYEPFGLAPLEAALCGCAVICRDIPSLREVWGDSALYFSDNGTLAKLIQELGWDYQLLSAAQARSRQRASLFTPERMADSYLHLFQTVLQQQATQHAA